MNVKSKFYVAFFIAFLLVSCQNKKTETLIVDTWANGKPKKTIEYIVDKNGNKTIYKETMFFQNEKTFIEGTYNPQQQRNGIWTSWFENGKKNSQGIFVNGKEDGKYTVWYPNGNLHYVGQYKNGKKTGTWKFYDESGKLLNEKTY